MIKLLEQYKVIDFRGKAVTIKLYADGSHKCSCKSVFCTHYEELRQQRIQRIVEMRRFV